MRHCLYSDFDQEKGNEFTERKGRRVSSVGETI
jgi:hypothetical protein